MIFTRFPTLVVAASVAMCGGTAALAQSATPEIVVSAPSYLSDRQTKEWGKLNKTSEKLDQRLVKLRKELDDDRDDVAEAQKKLKSEQSDMEKTERAIAKAEREMQKIAERRAELRSPAG